MWPSRYWWPWDTAENFWLGCFLPFPGSWGFSVRLHQCAAPTHQSSPGDSIALVNYSLLLTLLSAQVAVEITTDLSLGSLSSRSLAGNTWPQVSAVSADTGGVHLLPAAFYSQGRSRHPSASWKRLCTSAAKRTSKLCYTVASVIREQAENVEDKEKNQKLLEGDNSPPYEMHRWFQGMTAENQITRPSSQPRFITTDLQAKGRLFHKHVDSMAMF